MLNRIWRTPSFTRDERLAVVASLREEVDLNAPGGEAARAIIDAFIEKHLPAVR